MQIKVYSMRPFHDVDGLFTDIPGASTFDPKHPRTYPGAEVVPGEPVDVETFKAQHTNWREIIMSPDFLHTYRFDRTRQTHVIVPWHLTGRTSEDIINATV